MNTETAAEDLAGELAQMHVALFNLIVRLYKTPLSSTQKDLLLAADTELVASQKRFFAKYADMIGGANPEDN
jgi:hypothetical protein